MLVGARQQAYLGVQKILGSHVGDCLREFMGLEFGSASTLFSLQGERLAALLRHAATEVPFYRERVESNHNLGLADFPVLTKTLIRENFESLVHPKKLDAYRQLASGKGYSWCRVQTGGTSGAPTTVLHDAEYRDRGRAGRMYSQYLCGFPFGTPHAKLWGSMREINAIEESWTHRVQSWLAGEHLLNAFNMDQKAADRYLELLMRTGHRYLMTYVDVGVSLAMRALETGVRPELDSIMCCAGTVTEDVRSIMKEAFGGKVFNKYGSRECGELACECEYGSVHLYANNIYYEIVDDGGFPVSPGESGRLLVTLLANRIFPMIRYDIGDRVIAAAGDCECGRSFPAVAAIEGRESESLVRQDGSRVSPTFVRHLIGVVHNPNVIRRFQLVQESRQQLCLLVVPVLSMGLALLEDSIVKIERDLINVFGPTVHINTKIVEDIATELSGKYLYTVNRMPQKLPRCVF